VRCTPGAVLARPLHDLKDPNEFEPREQDQAAQTAGLARTTPIGLWAAGEVTVSGHVAEAALLVGTQAFAETADADMQAAHALMGESVAAIARSASSAAVASRSSLATTRLASPIRRASAASMTSPSRMSSRARLGALQASGIRN
jgi:hypothetical protein